MIVFTLCRRIAGCWYW